MIRLLRNFILLICMPFIATCLAQPGTEKPLPSIAIVNATAHNDTVVIMLPGRGDRADTFISEGFDKAGRQFGFDTIAVDAHFGYYIERNLLPRLHEDIVLPARAAGYKRVWLLGISMGGFGSVLYAASYPDMVDGVILLAPFLGERDAIDEIVANGELSRWDANESELEDHEIEVWSWLNSVTTGLEGTPLILGYGRSDRLAGAYSVLLDVLDPASVYTIRGGHNWRTWGPLWMSIAADIKL